MGIIVSHSNLCVLVNTIQQKAYYKDIVILSNTENGFRSFLSNLFTLLIDAKSYLATLNNGISRELLTLIYNEVLSLLKLLIDFDLQYNLFNDFLLISFKPQYNFFKTFDFTNLNTK